MPSKAKEVAKPIGAALLQSSSLSVSAPKLQCGTGRSKNGTTAQTRTVNRAAHHLRSKSSGRRRSADGDAGRNAGQFLGWSTGQKPMSRPRWKARRRRRRRRRHRFVGIRRVTRWRAESGVILSSAGGAVRSAVLSLASANRLTAPQLVVGLVPKQRTVCYCAVDFPSPEPDGVGCNLLWSADSICRSDTRVTA